MPQQRTTRAKASKAASMADKENQPPPKTKKSVSINGIFDQGKSMKQKREQEPSKDSRHILRPRANGISKQEAKSGYFAQNSKKAAQSKTANPDFLNNAEKYKTPGFGMGEAIGAYVSGVERQQAAKMERQRAALENREQGLDEDDEPVRGPWIPTEEDLDEVRAEIALLNQDVRKEIRGDMMSIRVSRKDGTTIDRQVAIGDVVDEFVKRHDKAQQILAQLQEEHDEIEEAIEEEAAKLKGSEGGANKSLKEFEAEMAALEEQKEQIEVDVEADYQQRLKEQKKQDRKRKKEFMAMMLAGMYD